MSFFKGKRVLVTGHTGFKGSWLAQTLLQLGAEVAGYALEPDPDALFAMLGLENRVKSFYGDIRDREKLRACVNEFQPEIVFHLAAQPLVRLSYREPETTFGTNVMGTVCLLEALRSCRSVRSIVNVTTDKVYQNREWEWGYRETDRLGGADPYSCSKACSELVTQCYRESFYAGNGVGLTAMRAGNVIGGGDFAEDRIVPDCVRAGIEGKPISVRNPASVRPYQYVLEVLAAYLMVAQKQWEDTAFAGNYNVGPESAGCVSTGQLAAAFCRCWGGGIYWTCAEPEGARLKESGFLRLDSSRIRQKIGWHSAMDFDEAMERTVRWYRAYHQKEDLFAVTVREIGDYFGRRGWNVGSAT